MANITYELPCNVNDLVYVIDEDRIWDFVVTSIVILGRTETNDTAYILHCKYNETDDGDETFSFTEVGKTLFFNGDDAEKAYTELTGKVFDWDTPLFC